MLSLREVSPEAPDAFGAQPQPSVGGFDVLEHVGDRKFLLLALRGLVSVVGERGNVDEPNDAIISARGRDDTAPVGVADKDRRAADPA